jgi:hypothetical protein
LRFGLSTHLITMVSTKLSSGFPHYNISLYLIYILRWRHLLILYNRRKIHWKISNNYNECTVSIRFMNIQLFWLRYGLPIMSLCNLFMHISYSVKENHNTIKFVMTFNHVYYKTFLPCIITRFDIVWMIFCFEPLTPTVIM